MRSYSSATADREALVDVPAGRRWTYAALNEDVDRLALALLAWGVAKGDRVGIWAPNCAEWVLVQYATAKIGAILVNVNPAYRGHELEYVVRQSGMRLLISALTHKGSDYRAMVSAIGFAEVVYLGDPGWERLLAMTLPVNMGEVAICYGMTETSPVSTMTRFDDDLERRTETVGRVMPHVEVKIVHPESGLTVARGEPGELCTRGYSVMLGYWAEPGKSAEAIDAARWMHTGDLATMDEDGYVSVVGRIKDMVIRGGENIYPREVEEFLYRHPDIADVQVIGVPDARYGEELMAWIVMRQDAQPLTVEVVREFCAGRLAHYKIPRYVHVVEGFPMTVTGKIRKVEMREESVRLLG